MKTDKTVGGKYKDVAEIAAKAYTEGHYFLSVKISETRGLYDAIRRDLAAKGYAEIDHYGRSIEAIERQGWSLHTITPASMTSSSIVGSHTEEAIVAHFRRRN